MLDFFPILCSLCSSVLTDVHSCIDAAVESCWVDLGAYLLAHELFQYRFKPTAPATCVEPFSWAANTNDMPPTQACISAFLGDLREGLETNRTMASVCKALAVTYLGCLDTLAADPTTLASVLNAATGYIRDVRDIFCVTGASS